MMRLNKYIAQSGVCSRRKADELIAAGQVKINGAVVKDLGVAVDETKDKVEVKGQPISLEEKKVYLAINKPIGYLSAAKSWQGESVLKLVKVPERVYPVGRLDKDSVGLLILTNDGDFAYNLTHAKFGHEKEYEVVFDDFLSRDDIKAFESGMMIDDQEIQPVKVTKVNGNTANLTLKEGINRQIRRMAEARGRKVRYLKRVRIGKLKLGDLKIGEYRAIKPSDVV
jgi:23S rRNA pseudouridine2605 synthase